MKFLVLGATGQTGALFVPLALDAGHEVTAITRSADTALDPRARRFVGEVTDAQTLANALVGVDAIISALGVNGLGGRPTLMTDVARAVIAAAGSSGVDRLLVVSAFGVGDSLAVSSLPARIVYRTWARNIYRDKAACEVLLRSSTLNWTIAYPGVLTSGNATAYTARPLGEVGRVRGLPPTSRANVADFLLESAVEATFEREVVVLFDAPPAQRCARQKSGSRGRASRSAACPHCLS